MKKPFIWDEYSDQSYPLKVKAFGLGFSKKVKQMSFHTNGFEIRRNFISKSNIEAIKNEVKNSHEIDIKHGIRSADKKINSIKTLANSKELINLADSILGSTPSIVRVIFFDKTPDKNWLVAWHQDKTVVLNKKLDIEGWENWTIKDSAHHAQPPLDVLNKMVTFRLHLDDADRNNGCLKIIPQSHKLGLLSHSELTDVVNNQEPYLCEVKAGDLVIMKPHIIHSSSKSLKPVHRRVVHIEYSNYPLPSTLEWL